MIDLNDDNFEDKGGNVFNDNKCGPVKCTLDRIERRTPDSKEGSPDFKLIYKDEADREINTAIWYPDFSNATDLEKAQKRTGKQFRHLVDTFSGGKTPLPKADSWEKLLDAVIDTLEHGGPKKTSLFANKTIYLATNFGVTSKTQQAFVRVRTFVPFMESEAAFKPESSKLNLGNIEWATPAVAEGAAPAANLAAGAPLAPPAP